VSHITEPPFTPQDLVVVLRPVKGTLQPLYAMECRMGKNKRIDHIELWVAQGLQASVVARIWWSLHGIFTVAQTLDSLAPPDATDYT
jgi:hypothetical protein